MADESSIGEAKAIREFGEVGLKQQQGFVMEDFIPKLKSLSSRIRVYKEMEKDPVIGSILFAIEMHLREADWHVNGEDERLVELVEHSRKNMSHTWEDFISEVLSMLPYGFSLHEIVYKIRDDGMITWKKLPLRSQDSIEKWEFDKKSGLNGVYQRRWSDNVRVFIPIEKLLLFRPSSFKNNPEGRSVFRSCYKAYYFKKKLETIEAIGVERDLSGYPVLHVPHEIFGESDRAKELRDLANKIVTRVRKDEQMGSVLPPNWELELLNASGNSQSRIGEVIDRYSVQIAQSLLSDIIMLGHQRSGSYALSEQKYELFILSLNSWLNSIEEVFNQYAIPRLMKLNGVDDESRYPKLVHDPVGRIDEQKLANAIFRLSGVDALNPDDPMEDYLRDFLGLPPKDPQTKRQGGKEGDQRQREDNVTRNPSTDGEYTNETSGHRGVN